ncbi:hypothetical protein QTP70_018871 [Hemibagrus guttatus]|uniref:Uncharacterized protein n=1 Tax=Hemibagrus guttatus TaxID=175788 RepID=A0AAE0PQU5_9TELE|nr:hypothetical protein QTP70_018871 [Hemibagrus guttatus]
MQMRSVTSCRAVMSSL